MNLDNVQHERVRKVIDLPFAAAKAELDACYYGETDRGAYKRDGLSGWKYGHAEPFRGLSPIVATLPAALAAYLGAEGQERLNEQQTTRLFNTIAGLMDLAYSVAKAKANRNLAKPYAEDEINPLLDHSKDRIVKGWAREHLEKFLAAVSLNPPATYGEAADMWNAITVSAGERSAKPLEIKRSAGHALDRLRDMEVKTGIKARDLTGTLPGA